MTQCWFCQHGSSQQDARVSVEMRLTNGHTRSEDIPRCVSCRSAHKLIDRLFAASILANVAVSITAGYMRHSIWVGLGVFAVGFLVWSAIPGAFRDRYYFPRKRTRRVQDVFEHPDIKKHKPSVSGWRISQR